MCTILVGRGVHYSRFLFYFLDRQTAKLKTTPNFPAILELNPNFDLGMGDWLSDLPDFSIVSWMTPDADNELPLGLIRSYQDLASRG